MDGRPQDPKQALSRLFGEAAASSEKSSSPFGESPVGSGPEYRLHAAITRLRILRSQAGSDGLTPAATRSVLDEVVAALEAIRDALPPDRSPDVDDDG